MSEFLWSYLPVAAFLVLLFAGGAWLARWQQSRGRFLGRPREATISWLGSYTEAFQRSLDLLPLIDAALLDADATRGFIIAGTGLSLKSWGTTLRIELLTQEGVTFVNLKAGPSASLLDWGESQALVNRFLRLWEAQPSPIAG